MRVRGRNHLKKQEPEINFTKEEEDVNMIPLNAYNQLEIWKTSDIPVYGDLNMGKPIVCVCVTFMISIVEVAKKLVCSRKVNFQYF